MKFGHFVLIFLVIIAALGSVIKISSDASGRELIKKLSNQKAVDLTADLTDPSGITKRNDEFGQRIQISINPDPETLYIEFGRVTVIGFIKVSQPPGDEDCKRLPGEMKPGTFTVNWDCRGVFLPETFKNIKLKDYPNAYVRIVPSGLYEFEADLGK